MSRLIKVGTALSVVAVICAAASDALANQEQNTTIRKVVVWESGEFMIETAGNLRCHKWLLGDVERTLLSTAMAAYLSGRAVNIVCTTGPSTVGVVYSDSYNLHRLILQ